MNTPRRRSIFLEVTHPKGTVGRIEGFRFMWAFYVNGYYPEKHCQPCFKGSRVPHFCTPSATSGQRIEFDRMDRQPYLYICGVGSGRKVELKEQNLHLPLMYAEGAVEEKTTYNGYRFRAENARRVSVPELPEGWQGKSREHWRCKNFQFAVAAFGYPPEGKSPSSALDERPE